MAKEFYDGAIENGSDQQFMTQMYQEDYDFTSYEEEDFENISEDVFAPFDTYDHEHNRYPMHNEMYHRPYPYPYYHYPMYGYHYPNYVYPYPMYRYPRYEMYRRYPVYPRFRY